MKNIKEFNYKILVESPGRINLIGEHIDYNGGNVLPAAIDKKIFLYFKKNLENSTCKVTSIHYNESITFEINKEKKELNSNWINYIFGVIHYLKKLKGDQLDGFECIIDSNLPLGSGISSSSALICGLIKGLNDLFKLKISNHEMINISQKVEHNFIGVKGGVMDQFAIFFGEKDKIILLNCNSLKLEMISGKLSPYKFLLLNTNVNHTLSSSDYNTRVKECKSALKKIKIENKKLSCLANASEDYIIKNESLFTKNEFKRALYVSQENQRVLKSSKLLKTSNFVDFGKLMYKSHEGLKNLYEVSCNELDYLVDHSKKYNYVLGSRMMGGGFGGCTINLIKEDYIKSYIKIVSEKYLNKFKKKLTSIEVSIEDGINTIKK
tara:strand:+ start:174 stop:1313 length:1140 start_codon:yes stop_codon:yes gene_type:complete